jgi:PBP1b-binding outer membrane lipoprotein LpoB
LQKSQILADAQNKDKHVMTKKIGRNEPCPCGSGKKYKKCCLDLNNSFDFTPPPVEEKANKTFDFIESNNSAQLLDFVIGLQLVPSNHGKNIRIEELATHIVRNLNDKSKGDLDLIKNHLDEVYDYHAMEDLPENLFARM